MESKVTKEPTSEPRVDNEDKRFHADNGKVIEEEEVSTIFDFSFF